MKTTVPITVLILMIDYSMNTIPMVFIKVLQKEDLRLLWRLIINITAYPVQLILYYVAVTMKEWGLRGIISTDGGAFKQLITTHAYYSSLPVAAAECIKAGITMFLDDYRASVKEALVKELIY